MVSVIVHRTEQADIPSLDPELQRKKAIRTVRHEKKSHPGREQLVEVRLEG